METAADRKANIDALKREGWKVIRERSPQVSASHPHLPPAYRFRVQRPDGELDTAVASMAYKAWTRALNLAWASAFTAVMTGA